MQAPKIEKIVLNMGLGLDACDSKILKVIQDRFSKLNWTASYCYQIQKSSSKFQN